MAATPQESGDADVLSEGMQQQPVHDRASDKDDQQSEIISSAVAHSDAYALQAIHIANQALVRAGGIALLKPIGPRLKQEAWDLIVTHTTEEIKAALLTRELKVNVNATGVELAALKMEVDDALGALRASPIETFEKVYYDQIEVILSGLVETLDHAFTEGFTKNKVENFVNEVYTQAQDDLDARAPMTEAW